LVYKTTYTMRKIIFIVLFNIIGSALLNAQVADTAVAAARYSFSHIMDTTQPNNPLKENMILYLGKNMSNYTSYDRIERVAKMKTNAQSIGTAADMKNVDMSTVKSMSVEGGIVSITSNGGAVAVFNVNPQMTFVNSYFKDQANIKLTYLASANGKLFSVEEKIPAINWNITQETKNIQGLECQKAVGDCKGRVYEAWFCSQLPYNNGPWKLGGLPGLIVEAYDTKKEVVFSLTSFENIVSGPAVIALPTDVIKTTPKEFNQYQEAVKKDRAAMMGSSSGGGGGVVGVTNVRRSDAAVNGKPSSAENRPRQMNNPIEKEIIK